MHHGVRTALVAAAATAAAFMGVASHAAAASSVRGAGIGQSNRCDTAPQTSLLQLPNPNGEMNIGPACLNAGSGRTPQSNECSTLSNITEPGALVGPTDEFNFGPRCLNVPAHGLIG